MASVRVAVRVRPLNKREKQLKSKTVTRFKGNTVTISKPKDRGKTFTFDFLHDSTDRSSPTFASQEKIFHDLGNDVLNAAFEGYNACVFAYGQTGSGKSYTMMGHAEDKGLIPRICEGLFREISQRSKNDEVSFHTEVSFLEIYNERVQDLLKRRPTSTDGGGLRVREHPKDGPYVEDLSKHLVQTHSNIEELIGLGNSNRTTASTGMNDCSSRSHAIFTISFTQAWFDDNLPCEMLSKIHMVDLAGSERADATRSTGARLKEGANINKSLVTLGSVISALDLGVGEHTTKKMIFIPYRDSVLTWLLKDSLGGNSKTTMIATISPADVNYGETLSTLYYASRAKNVVNSPTVNEDCSVKVIRELQAEVTRLRRLLEEAKQVSHRELSSLEVELHQNKAKEETVALKEEGSGVVLDCQLPHLIGMDEDLLSSGIILYYLKNGRTLIGRDKTSCSQDIAIHRPGLHSVHCVFENHAGTVTLIPQDGALCSVNGTVVTHPCQLTQGAIIQLGRQTTFRFNHPSEAAHLKEKHQSEQPSASSLSLIDVFKSENLSKLMLQNPGKMEEKLSQQEGEWRQQVQHSLKGQNQEIKGVQKEPIGPPHPHQGDKKTNGAEMDETGDDQMDIVAAAVSKIQSSSSPLPTADKLPTVIPGKYLVPPASFELIGDMPQGEVNTRDGLTQETDWCHKSGPVSEQLRQRAESVAQVSCYKAQEVWSGDGSLQQTSVLGPGDGCGTRPEGNANEIQGVAAHCYKGRPGSGGSSLSSTSHPQSAGGTSSTSVLSQTNTRSQLEKKPLSSQAACCPSGETLLKGQSSCGEMDESGGLEKECVTKTAGAAVRSSGLASLVSGVTRLVRDPWQLLLNFPTVLQQVREEGQHHWSRYVVSLTGEIRVLSAMNSQVLSLFKGSRVFSRFKSSYSMVKELPLMQHIHTDITQHFWSVEAARIIQGYISPQITQLPAIIKTQNAMKTEEIPDHLPLIQDDVWDLNLPQQQNGADINVKKAAKMMMGHVKHSRTSNAPADKDQAFESTVTIQNMEDVQIFCLTLIEFPDALMNLQTLPLQDLVTSLQSTLSTSMFTSQKIVALFWLNVAKCSQPKPRPALLILMETGLYTITSESGILLLFHHLPLLQLKEVQMGLAGLSLRLMGITEESILGLYTYSQKITKELCLAILGVLYPGDSRVSQHPLLRMDWMTGWERMSVDWQAHVPDLLLDAGLKVCCQFQKRFADLIYLLHCNMEQKAVPLGEVQLLLYTSVGVCISSGSCTAPVAQLLLTDTHLGLVQEDIVFYPTPRSVTIQPSRPQFHNLILRQCSDVRCVLVHDEDKHGAIRLDVILANTRARGHSESMTKAATLPALASNPSPHAEVWKLTFSCSTEAACLINHLSNV